MPLESDSPIHELKPFRLCSFPEQKSAPIFEDWPYSPSNSGRSRYWVASCDSSRILCCSALSQRLSTFSANQHPPPLSSMFEMDLFVRNAFLLTGSWWNEILDGVRRMPLEYKDFQKENKMAYSVLKKEQDSLAQVYWTVEIGAARDPFLFGLAEKVFFGVLSPQSGNLSDRTRAGGLFLPPTPACCEIQSVMFTIRRLMFSDGTAKSR